MPPPPLPNAATGPPPLPKAAGGPPPLPKAGGGPPPLPKAASGPLPLPKAAGIPPPLPKAAGDPPAETNGEATEAPVPVAPPTHPTSSPSAAESAPPVASLDSPSTLVGKTVWVPDDSDDLYKRVTVSEAQDVSVKLASGESVPLGQVALLDPADAEEADLVQMANIDTPNILHTLRERHGSGSVYTAVGQKGIQISINPYKWIGGLYDVELMHSYYEAFEGTDLPPHIFSLTAEAYKALCMHGKSQCIVTSGESGSGKTENSKQVFRFLAEVAGVQGPQDGADGTEISLQDLLVHSNPVLEAFGNAKTLRNDNSSRFGKLVTVHFDSSGRIVGAFTRNYLLERTRCSNPPLGERNYHSFYQLLTGASEAIRTRCGLASQQAKNYLMLAQSKCATVDTIDDKAEWQDTMKAAQMLGFSAEEVDGMVDILGALLHMGNARFTAEVTEHGDDCAKLVDTASVDYASFLLGADRMAVVSGFISIRVKTQRDDLSSRLTTAAALKNRDAFVAAMYAGLFDWIVNRINAVGRRDEQHSDEAAAMGKFIGVLDIFGFEIFQTNSFEQLCINFANEKLQRNFTMTTFQAEEGLYEAEGIAFDHIPYIDNQPVLDLLDLTPAAKADANANLKGLAAKAATRGIIQMIDEEVRLPKVSDRGTLLIKMNQSFGGDAAGRGGHPAYGTDYRTREAKESLFTIKHYAGDVVYCIDGFLEKSMENISAELVAAMTQSAKPLVSSIFTQGSARGGGSGAGGGGGSRKPSVGSKFSKQLASLIGTIEQTDAHFIRCIKPNTTKSSTLFDSKLTLEQLRHAHPSWYSGVFEAVTIRKHGYPFRQTHKEFCLRYRLLLPLARRLSLSWDFANAAVTRKMAEELIGMLPKESELYTRHAAFRGADLSANCRVGSTRVFYRSAENRALEGSREEVVIPIIKLSQRTARGAIARGVRRELAHARQQLAEAVAKKHLETLEEALSQAQVPHRAFSKGAAVLFTLPIPNMAEISALLADLRLEPVVDRTLGIACSEADLAAQYDTIADNLEVAEGLAARLGREVPWMKYAVAIVGLTQGVEDHDHERLVACLSASEALGIAPRLVNESERARAEIKMLEAGFPFEAALTAELGKGRSKYTGSASWDHSQITKESLATLQQALDSGAGYPLVSKSGLRLCSCARAALNIRAQLAAEDWSSLVTTLNELKAAGGEQVAGRKRSKIEAERKKALMAAIAADVSQYDEVVAGWSELNDVCSVREEALVTALKQGRSKRVGVGTEVKWNHNGIETASLLVAQKAVTDFAYVTERGQALLGEAALCVQIREALKVCAWGKAASWEPLAQLLDSQVPQSLRNAEEVQLAWQEFGDVRKGTEAAVQAALNTGRSVKRTGAATAAAGGGQWDHSGISTTALEAALAELEAFPRISDVGRALAARAVRAVMLRGALKQADVADPSSWGPVAEVLDASADRSASAYDASSGPGANDEITAAREELDSMRALYEGKVKGEMDKGRSMPGGGAARAPVGQAPPAWADKYKPWNRSGLSAVALTEAVDLCAAFPRPSSATTTLIEIGRIVIELRQTLLQTSWSSAASWAPLADFLDGGELDLSRHDADEIRDVQLEMSQAQLSYEAAVSAALASGASTKTPSGWSHEGIDTTALDAALAEMRAFPRMSDNGRSISEQADLIVALRGALLQCSWSQPASWSVLLEVLDAIPPGEMRDLGEVRAAWKELLEYRDSIEAALRKTLTTGRSERVTTQGGTPSSPVRRLSSPSSPSKRGGSGGEPAAEVQWSHDALSTDGVADALAALRAFPRQSEGGSTLALLADAVLELRVLLTRCRWDVPLQRDSDVRDAWAQLGDWCAAAAKSAYGSEEEVQAASEELSDRRGALEERVLYQLARGRSVRAVGSQFGAKKGGGWKHDAIMVEPLAEAADECEAFPRPSERGRAVVALARVSILVRRALLQCSWDHSASWVPLVRALEEGAALPRPADMPGLPEHEFDDARAELEEMRLHTEAQLQQALAEGHSVKTRGQDKWDHSGIATAPLDAALVNVTEFPAMSDVGRALAAEGRLVLQVRCALLQCDWGKAASWMPLISALDAVPAEHAEQTEIASAAMEMVDKRADTLKAVRAAMARGGSMKTASAPSGWSHDAIEVEPLIAAADECEAFPRPTAEATSLVASARLIATLRQALLQVVPGSATSWSALAGALADLPADDLALEEVKGALLEFRQAREAVVNTVLNAMRNGCSKPPPGSMSKQPWDHSAMDSESLVRAALQLEQFPRVEGSGQSEGESARRVSIVARRASLARLAEESDALVSSAKRLARLREMLQSNAWAEVDAFLKALEGGGAPQAALHEIAADEARRAAQELQDVASSLEAAVQLSLNSGQSKPPKSGTGRWDHSGLQVEELRAAVDALASYPLKGAVADALLERAEVIARLREFLHSGAWGELSQHLASLGSAMQQEREVANAATEVEDMRAVSEAEVKEAMSAGRSLKVIGKKTTLVSKEWYVAVSWDHTALEEGISKLQDAVDFLVSFPNQKPNLEELLRDATHTLAIRKHLLAEQWGGLRELLVSVDGTPLEKMEETGVAWQELLCHELTVATGGRGVPADQEALKVGLQAANMRGLLPHEQQVFKALERFIDPPEFLVDLDHPGGDVFPGEDGSVVLTVKVRGAKSYRWFKNSVALKEGHNHTGVETPHLTFSEILGRDVDQKVWCEATNKWGTVKSKIVALRVPDTQRSEAKQYDNDVQLSWAEQEKRKQEKAKHQQNQQKLNSSLQQLSSLQRQGSSMREGLQAFSGKL